MTEPPDFGLCAKLAPDVQIVIHLDHRFGCAFQLTLFELHPTHHQHTQDWADLLCHVIAKYCHYIFSINTCLTEPRKRCFQEGATVEEEVLCQRGNPEVYGGIRDQRLARCQPSCSTLQQQISSPSAVGEQQKCSGGCSWSTQAGARQCESGSLAISIQFKFHSYLNVSKDVSSPDFLLNAALLIVTLFSRLTYLEASAQVVSTS